MFPKKFFVIFSVFLLNLSVLFSFTVNKNCFANVDSAFESSSIAELNTVLESNKDADDYEVLEQYVLSKINELVINEKFDFAQEAALALINNNIANFEAVEIYSFIHKSIYGGEHSPAMDRILGY